MEATTYVDSLSGAIYPAVKRTRLASQGGGVREEIVHAGSPKA